MPIPHVIMHGLLCTEGTICIAVGRADAGGRIFRSGDAGTHWTNTAIPDGISDVYAVACRSDSRCIATASQATPADGILLVSDDAAQTWKPAVLPYPGTPQIISCYSDGCLLTLRSGGGDSLLSSSNGGSSWTVVRDPANPGDAVQGIWCFDSVGCWLSVGTDAAQLYVSSNLGTSWRPTRIGAAFPIAGVVCDAPTDCWASGMSGLFRTPDSGESWEKHTTHPTLIGTGLVACGTSGTCVTIMSNIETRSPVSIFYRRDGRIDTVAHPLPPSARLRGLACSGQTRCVVVGDDLILTEG